ncbi:MAG: DMT family transporter [Alphaproteobacteria bacterium]|nr:DMT family transporter [Alphaproteobacteria bacterium]
MLREHKSFPLLILTISIFAMAGGTVFARSSDGNVFADMFFRLIFALPFYGLILIKQKKYHRKDWQDSRWNVVLLIMAGIFFALDNLFLFSAINYINIGFAFLISTCAPIILLPLSALIYRELPPKLFWTGLILAMIGMYLAIGTGKGGSTGNPEEWKGFFYAACALASFGLYIFILNYCQSKLNTWQKTSYIAGSAVITIAIIATISGHSLLLPNAISWLAVLGFSIVSQVLGVSLFIFSISRIPLNLSGALVLGLPFAGSIYGWLFFKENITWLGFSGMVICLIGIYLAKRAYDDIEKAHGHEPQEKITPPT